MKSTNQVSKGYLRRVFVFFLVYSPKPFKLRVKRKSLDLLLQYEQVIQTISIDCCPCDSLPQRLYVDLC